MTEVDELLARLRKLPAVALDSEFEALAVTVVLYLGWALHFTSALYR